jgi:hypothetical protein
VAQDEEVDDRLLAVETTVQRLRSGEPVTGLPTLDSIAPDLAKALAKWWGMPAQIGNEIGAPTTPERKSAADRLVEYALASGAEFFHDEQEEPFVAIARRWPRPSRRSHRSRCLTVSSTH